jgi:ribosome-associated protein
LGPNGIRSLCLTDLNFSLPWSAIAAEKSGANVVLGISVGKGNQALDAMAVSYCGQQACLLRCVNRREKGMKHLNEAELQWQFVRASGPGGQNVNKVSSAVELRLDVAGSPSLTQEIKDRLRRIAGRRMTADGTLVIDAQRFRSQARNREDALERLYALIEQATRRPKRRIQTAPSAASRKRRLESKRKRSTLKRERRSKEDV